MDIIAPAAAAAAAAAALQVPEDNNNDDDDEDAAEDEDGEGGNDLPVFERRPPNLQIIDNNDDSEGTWLGLINNDDLEFTNMLLHYPRAFFPSSFMPLTEDFQSWGRPSAPRLPPPPPNHHPQRHQHQPSSSSSSSSSSPTGRGNRTSSLQKNHHNNPGSSCSSSSCASDTVASIDNHYAPNPNSHHNNNNNSSSSSRTPRQQHDPYYLCLDWTAESMTNTARRNKLLQKFKNRQGIDRLVVALCDLTEHIEDSTHIMDVLMEESDPDRAWKSISFLGSIHFGYHVERYEARNLHHISGIVINALRNVGTLNFLFMFLDYEAISQRLLRRLPSLHTLRFKKCPVFMDEILELVRTMETHGRVTSLCFSDCTFLGRPSTTEFMAEFVGRLSNVRNLITLQLNSCEISETCLCQIIDILQRHPTLACLDVGGNRCYTDESIHAVSTMLSRKRFKLVDLNLSGVWGIRGRTRNLNFQPLFTALATNQRLKRLDFSCNTVRHEDIPHLAQALQINTELLSIDLRHMVDVDLSGGGGGTMTTTTNNNNNMDAFAQQHTISPQVLSDALEEALFQSVKKNHSLQCLRISVNEPSSSFPDEDNADEDENDADADGDDNDNDNEGEDDDHEGDMYANAIDPQNNNPNSHHQNQFPSDHRFLSFSRLEFYPYLNWAGRHLLSHANNNNDRSGRDGDGGGGGGEVPLALWPHVWQRVMQDTNHRYHKKQCIPSAIFHMLRCPDGDIASLPLAVSIATRSTQEQSILQEQEREQRQGKTSSPESKMGQPAVAAAAAAAAAAITTRENKRQPKSSTSKSDKSCRVGVNTSDDVLGDDDSDCRKKSPEQDMEEPIAKRRRGQRGKSRSK